LLAFQEALFRVHSRVTEGDGDTPGGAACVRLLVPERCNGALLGRGGATIAALRDATGCYIRLAPHSAADALLSISGEPAAVRAALQDVSARLRAAPRSHRAQPAALGGAPAPPLLPPLQQLAAAYAASAAHAHAHARALAALSALHAAAAAAPPPPGTPPARAPPPPLLAALLAPPPVELLYRLLCPAARVGALLGRGGEVVAALRASTGARIKISDAQPAGAASGWSEERIVTITCADSGAGCSAAAQAALLRVYAAIAAGCVCDHMCMRPLPLAARLLLAAPEAAALRTPHGAAWLEALRRDTRCAARLACGEAPDADAVLELPCDADAPAAALAALAAVAARLRDATLHPGCFDAAAAACTQPYGTPRAASPPPAASLELLLPGAAAGAVIGRSGAAIRALRAASGANIKLHDAVLADGGSRRLHISGSAAAVDAAQAMLAAALKEAQPAAARLLAAAQRALAPPALCC
jgi:predicted RNA-binding protein YlqC (UPF0109 family)